MYDIYIARLVGASRRERLERRYFVVLNLVKGLPLLVSLVALDSFEDACVVVIHSGLRDEFLTVRLCERDVPARSLLQSIRTIHETGVKGF